MKTVNWLSIFSPDGATVKGIQITISTCNKRNTLINLIVLSRRDIIQFHGNVASINIFISIEIYIYS